MEAVRSDVQGIIRFPVSIISHESRVRRIFNCTPVLIFFPFSQILILELSGVLMPSHVIVNLDIEEPSLQIENMCVDCMMNNCTKVHDWSFTADMIRSVRYDVFPYFSYL